MFADILPRRPIRPHEFPDRETVGKTKSRSRYPLKKSPSIGELIREYFTNSTLHGLRYIGDKDLSFIERGFFGFFFIIANLLVAYFISNVWNKWSASPIIITYSATATSMKDIPFPAVTICSMNQAKASVVKGLNKNEIPFLNSLCSNDLEHGASDNNYTGKWESFPKFVAKTSPICIDILKYCRYGHKEFPCLQHFRPILTDDGLCCIFNGVDYKYLLKDAGSQVNIPLNNRIASTIQEIDWTPEKGYRGGNTTNVNPRVAEGTGYQMGLTVILNAEADEYYCGSSNSIGFKILLHNPTEIPKVADYGSSIGVGWETRMLVNPHIADATELVRDIPLNVRQCKFEDEGNLTYYRTYSQTNCEMECETHLYETKCECVMYFMPKTKPNINICINIHKGCVDHVRDLIAGGECDCVPGCFEMNYGNDIYTTRLADYRNFTHQLPSLNAINESLWRDNIAVVNIYYETNFFRRFTKEELIGLTDFISNTGGLLGLSLGFSIISLVEIIYFITLRPIFKNRNNRHRNKMENVIMVAPKRFDSMKWEDESYCRKFKDFILQKLFRKSKEIDGPKYPYHE